MPASTAAMATRTPRTMPANAPLERPESSVLVDEVDDGDEDVLDIDALVDVLVIGFVL